MKAVRFTRRRLALVVAFGCAAAGLAARSSFPQQGSVQQGSLLQMPTIKTTTRLVVLNVVVTDRAGNLVTGLTRDDFTALESNERQNITSFEAPPASFSPSAAGGPSGAEVAVASSATPRTILVFDQLNTESVDLMVALQKMKSYLEAQPAHLAQPTSLFSLNKRKLELLVQATQDRDAILSAIRKNIIELPPTSMENGGVQGGADRLLTSLLALDEIALSSAEQKARKNVIWVGNGIPILSYGAATLLDKTKYQAWLHYTVNWLQETQTTVYTLDPHGVAVSSESIGTYTGSGVISGPGLTDSDLYFESLATQTGGKIMRNRNDLDVAIASAVKEGSSAYTLAYYPTNDKWDSSFRPIRVLVARQGVSARTQMGYYAIPEGFEEGPNQVEFGLSRAVTSPVPFHSVEFSAKGRIVPASSKPQQRMGTSSFRTGAKATAAAAQLPTARIDVTVERDSLSWMPQANGDQMTEFALVTSSVSASGEILDNQIHRLEFSQKKDVFAMVPPEPVKLFVFADLPPKTDHLRLVVRDSSNGHLGTYDLPVAALNH